MAYVRGDVYMYRSASGFHCIHCRISETPNFFTTLLTTILEHMRMHLQHGDDVQAAVDRLEREMGITVRRVTREEKGVVMDPAIFDDGLPHEDLKPVLNELLVRLRLEADGRWSCYIIEFGPVDIPGVVMYGSTREEAFRLATAAIDELRIEYGREVAG
jgi:predicted RNase H-like HicB family nuclease